MNKKLLLVLAVASGSFALPTKNYLQSFQSGADSGFMKSISGLLKEVFSENDAPSLPQITEFLQAQSGSLRPQVIDKVIASVECAREKRVPVNHILTVIDYSLPSNEKRLWVFDLKNKDTLFHTYVSHGLTSGHLDTEFFSNKFDSKASSIGVYQTDKSYYGREGLSLRLNGLDRGFNDNAQNRYIVMHGGWYMDEGFIKKYGRPGKSWGCPAMPQEVSGSIINTIKEHSLMVVYYPDEHWLSSSRLLNCKHFSMTPTTVKTDNQNISLLPSMQHEPILYLDMNKNNKREEHEPILVMDADTYAQIFNTSPPLTRMLRRQINKVEYIALTQSEFQKIVQNKSQDDLHTNSFAKVQFIVPVLKMKRGYYETEMHPVPLGDIKNARLESDEHFVLDFEKKSSVHLKTTSQFIRWLGL